MLEQKQTLTVCQLPCQIKLCINCKTADKKRTWIITQKKHLEKF